MGGTFLAKNVLSNLAFELGSQTRLLGEPLRPNMVSWAAITNQFLGHAFAFPQQK
jgi:hypothetical protein